MKKLSILFFAFIIGFAGTLKADEGMWLLPLIKKLNMNKMQEMGLELSAEDIYSVNNSSMKDAIVIFGGGCTGELISDQGLILTNHHCGYGDIQALSSEENNYLKDGFWANSLDEELHAEGLSVTFLKKMEEVTDRVFEGIDEAEGIDKRNELISKNISAITKEASEGNDYTIRVQSFFEGNQYFLVAYEKFNDVRFVGAPPSSIGKFGHDTDNWMWPRHTGDFSLFRVYADKDGKPADYSKDNVPFKPANHLPISLKGAQSGDFAMTLGYPGSTSRYLTSWGIKERMDVINDSRIVPRGVKQELWREDMMASEKVNIQYASKYSRSSNYWKNSIGMNRGLERLKVVDEKQKLEKEFANWVAASTERTAEYGEVLSNLEKVYSNRASDLKAQNYLVECMLRGTEIIALGTRAIQLEKELAQGNKERVAQIAEAITESLDGFFKDYNVSTDHKVFATMLELYHNKIDAQYHPSFFTEVVEKKHKGDFKKYGDWVFRKSMFVDKNELETFLAAPKLKTLRKDPVFIAALSTMDMYRQIYGKVSVTNTVENENNRLFLKGLMEMYPDKVFYPDANFTMRLSYGKVGNYKPKDAVIYEYFTTLAGVIEKHVPGDFEFEVPEKLIELYQNKDYGQYADVDGTMRVCFTTDNDITGGNSGSPVINGNGELFGLAFDGNWEAMSGDVTFETELQKCINVDIRYVLFIIDKFAGATNLIDEMTLVK
ncbi:dipeptidyl-peptidase 7. Serine peptidase. MEROPS family S46 [Saccharicrinis carchari]|uniref:Dipeptidyl-peptidase n=1 Tax=Saccharicrinis carchari TaxID=1168039 RepID=A0A521DCP2_SACCC|nr:S46 family peptidase [Saccharicrinis carchari]SMO69342.1 dipeptidyl-peptidase 7. Serine peptidase. MEROPS family S46 [Saccharicrinis carchari]